ncbi:hypothetical protein SASPL_101509 [Salvia splendens]|uniref:Peptide N-acetyl-beta-D-glucosaminyl asparaginase amidase A N-terminal domain-containing protein n=1 Tax=Salvia splendens TaxID=180675 RepID=A0A8X8YVW8_SALSN|nr:hypothetical protein SASPL_101509 [Salvia splendens]
MKLNDNVVGSVIPFPVIYGGGIDPLLWKPLVSIGAFDFPSYEIELTPYLGIMLEKRNNLHSLGLEVADALPYWLIDANLYLWIDSNGDSVSTGPIEYSDPRVRLERESKFHDLDGKYKVEGETKREASGGVHAIWWALAAASPPISTPVADHPLAAVTGSPLPDGRAAGPPPSPPVQVAAWLPIGVAKNSPPSALLIANLPLVTGFRLVGGFWRILISLNVVKLFSTADDYSHEAGPDSESVRVVDEVRVKSDAGHSVAEMARERRYRATGVDVCAGGRDIVRGGGDFAELPRPMRGMFWQMEGNDTHTASS